MEIDFTDNEAFVIFPKQSLGYNTAFSICIVILMKM